VRPVVDAVRLESAVKNWPTGGWHTTEIFEQYNLAVTRGVASGRFLLLPWFESVN
jgi:asparagine synthase (glutamine-hydrolysing)